MFTMPNGQYEIYEEYRGLVENVSQRSDTHVSAPGSVVGGNAPITSKVTVNNDFWVKRSDGKQEKFSYNGESFVAPGHIVSILAIRHTNPKDDGMRYSVNNLTTDESRYLWGDAAVNHYDINPISTPRKFIFYFLFWCFFVGLALNQTFGFYYTYWFIAWGVTGVQSFRAIRGFGKRNDALVKLLKNEEVLLNIKL